MSASGVARILAQLQLRNSRCDVQSGASFGAQRLKRKVFGIATDERICAKTQSYRCAGRGADVSSGKGTIADAGRGRINNQPTHVALAGDTNIDPEPADRSSVALDLSDTLLERALKRTA